MKKLLCASVLAILPCAASAEVGTGGYGGVSYGGSDIDVSGGLSGDGDSLGLFAGYTWDHGDLLYGFETDWDRTDYAINGGAVNIDHTARLKARLGIPLGGGQGYATAGLVRAGTDTIGEDTGYLYGLGFDVPLSDGMLLGGEILQHEFDDFDGGGLDVSVTTFKARLAFRF